MQVAKANPNLPLSAKLSVEPATRSSTSYAPLYLSTSLGNSSFDIEDLEAIALERLRLLKHIEREKAKTYAASTTKPDIKALRKSIRTVERQYGLNVPAPSSGERSERILKDEASHFLLRLALCKTHEHRQFLLHAECELFATRLEMTGVDFALSTIAKYNDCPKVQRVSPTEMDTFQVQLDSVCRGCNRMKIGDVRQMPFYKVEFQQVPSLVRNRKVFVTGGFAYIPERNVVDIVVAQFRAKLNQGLLIANKAVMKADSDQRMKPILESIRQYFFTIDNHHNGRQNFDGTDANALKVDKISLNDMTNVEHTLQCIPLCMQFMLHKLDLNCHLRHSGRMQLGVFLKGCGLTMDESLTFWRLKFTKKSTITSDQFDKNYSYNIRHHYGKEGKRKNLTPYNCTKIINDQPGPGEFHGCPYRQLQGVQLKQALKSLAGVQDQQAIEAIVDHASKGSFQLACSTTFQSTQPGNHAMDENNGLPEYVPSHPNEYFIEARRRRLGVDEHAANNMDEDVIDDDLDEDEMISAALAAESQTPSKSQASDRDKDEQEQMVLSNDGQTECDEKKINEDVDMIVKEGQEQKEQRRVKKCMEKSPEGKGEEGGCTEERQEESGDRDNSEGKQESVVTESVVKSEAEVQKVAGDENENEKDAEKERPCKMAKKE